MKRLLFLPLNCEIAVWHLRLRVRYLSGLEDALSVDSFGGAWVTNICRDSKVLVGMDVVAKLARGLPLLN